MDPNFPKNNPKIKIISTIQQPPSQNSNERQNVNSNIKVKQEPQVNPQRANEFENLFQRVQQDIEQDDVLYNLSPQMENEQVNYQFWRFEFSGQGNFEGKCISGVLKLQSDHPVSPPVFYFDSIFIEQKYEVLQHLNIYGDHTLCIPLFSYWKKTTSEYEILQAIEHIFHNPNFQEGDAPANPNFASQTEEQKNQIQRRQAKYLPDFQKAQ
ncbi:unnamed protein product (macronuclear) [Paramecium tetraurelia]|uniref:UBC core domain-containing protein n=1 Tax=Paramecium tetraurelia TaxID=5888 RepID=A0DPR3_PARTE|nr:uncharacterized protein GSPATT00019212001 [Paramecium tetraurelia]CAK85030.1 unnamed protein product [Paramecium tetraurelia]|eukprot:XP_001452427.1 hypothetical protein (macronuclear) [Paramecium tetraurelia strain d4-2]